MNFVDYLFEANKDLSKNVVVGNVESISYADLYHTHVFRISGWLSQKYGSHEKILLISDNSVFFIGAYLGIIHSGNICVPLNPSITSTSLQYIATQCAAKVAFVEKRYEKKLDDLDLEIITQDLIFGDSLSFSMPTGGGQVFDHDQIAEIIFTSGSTALPKGVMLSHKNLRANTDSIIQYLALTDNDRVAVVLPFYYCYGLSLLHTHIKVGASLVLNNTFMMVNTVIDDLLNFQCTGFSGVPSHYQILLRKSRRFRSTPFPHLRYVTQAGGKLPTVFIEDFLQTFPNVKFYVMYGQTEATARLSYLPPNCLPEKLGSIGKGMPGVKLEVVNEAMQPVKPNELGEIVAEGDNIMVGYFEDQSLTAETIKAGRLHTGDLGTIDSEGYIYVLAREKEYLKVSGERISPKEIEDVIVSLPSVVDCSIIGVEDDILGEAIKAFIVLEVNASLTKDEILDFCNQRLSSTKLPKFIEFIDEIPVSPTGKKLRSVLEQLGA